VGLGLATAKPLRGKGEEGGRKRGREGFVLHVAEPRVGSTGCKEMVSNL